MAALEIPYSVRTLNPLPVEFYRGPWANVAAAKAGVPLAVRHDGLTVKVIGAGEYWWLAADLSDAGLTAKPAGATGTVTSIAFSGGTTGLTFSGGPITTTGTITTGGTLVVANGGTGLTTLGTANQLLAVNSGATALEYKTVSNGLIAASGTVQLGGSLTANTTITTTGFNFRVGTATVTPVLSILPTVAIISSLGVNTSRSSNLQLDSTGHYSFITQDTSLVNIKGISTDTAGIYTYFAPDATGLASPNRNVIYINVNSVDTLFNGIVLSRMTANGTYLGPATATAKLHLPASTATASTAPLKLTVGGTLLTTPEAGAVEVTNSHVYWTDSSGTRWQLDQQGSLTVAGASTEIQTNNGSSNLGSGKVFIPSNGNINLGDSGLVTTDRFITAVGSASSTNISLVAAGTTAFVGLSVGGQTTKLDLTTYNSDSVHRLAFGNNASGPAVGGLITVNGDGTGTVTGASLYLKAGTPGSGTNNGGSIYLTAGSKTGSGTPGSIFLATSVGSITLAGNGNMILSSVAGSVTTTVTSGTTGFSVTTGGTGGSISFGTNVGFFNAGTSIFGTGTGVIYIEPASVNPSTAVATGGVMYVKSSDGLPYWRHLTTDYAMTGGGFADPLTTNGDIIARISGTTTRLAQGVNSTFLGVNGSGALGYYALPAAAGSWAVTGTTTITGDVTITGPHNFLFTNTTVGAGWASDIQINPASVVLEMIKDIGGASPVTSTITLDPNGITLLTHGFNDAITLDGSSVSGPYGIILNGNILGANGKYTFAASSTGKASLNIPSGTAPTSAVQGDLYYDGTHLYFKPSGSAVDLLAGGGGGSGTVTTVSVVTANGISGTVATATTTPAITLTLGVITPTSVNGVVFSGSSTPTLAVTGTSSISGANTGDQTSVTGNAGTATALQTARTINGTSFNGTANITVTADASTLTNATLNATVVTSSLTTVGTIGTGTWQGSVVAGQYGGTGVANTGKTITLGGNLTLSGAFATTFTVGATTTVTLPATGTLATLAGTETLTNKTVNGVVLTTGGSATNFLNGAGSYISTGTVTTVSVVTANGISGTVATASSTPAITLTLGAITPTSVNGVAAATIAFLDATSSVQTQIDSKQAKVITFNNQTVSYTLVLADKDKGIEVNSSSATNITIPLNATVAFPVGVQIPIFIEGTGTATVVATGGVTLRNSAGVNTSAGQNTIMYLIQRVTDDWYLLNGTAASGSGTGGVTIQNISASATINTAAATTYTIFVDATSGNVVLTLPTGSSTTMHIIRRIDTSTNTVTFSGTVTGFGTSGTNLLAGNGFIMTYNGTNFYAN